MSKESKRLRKKAANELRSSRKQGSPATGDKHVMRAASYKALASNEEWLAGERPQSGKPIRRKK